VYKAVDDDGRDQARFPVMTREDPRATREGARVSPLGHPACLTAKEDHR
jgi:hypothetical protein